MKLNPHSYQAYLECPKKYFLEYVRKQPPTVPKNDYFALYGKLVEKFFEIFCNTWRFKTPYMFPEVIKEKLEILWQGILDSSIIDWSFRYAKYTKDEIFTQAYNDICTIMNSNNQNYFLNTKSEISIAISLKDEDIINGRIDFIHIDPLSNSSVSIIDGKGTNKIGKNINKNQLLFYSLLYYFHYKVLPIEVGFFYYRFNSFNPISFNLDILNEFRAILSYDIKRIKSDSLYTPTPSPKSCKYCGYNNSCKEYMSMKASRAKPSKLKELQGEGVIEFGL
jgi:CRISPR/Cas system-associated exonuclease Cas4 (RecB family)